MLGFFFFFSSRRRHTRFDCDWSSDVCSSDLARRSAPARRRARGHLRSVPRPPSTAGRRAVGGAERVELPPRSRALAVGLRDRKSTRLNSSHSQISYAVFCLKKKKNGQ